MTLKSGNLRGAKGALRGPVILYLEMGAGYTGVFSLSKFAKLYTYHICPLL